MAKNDLMKKYKTARNKINELEEELTAKYDIIKDLERT